MKIWARNQLWVWINDSQTALPYSSVGFRHPDASGYSLITWGCASLREGVGEGQGEKRKEEGRKERMNKINRIGIQIGYLRLYCIFFFPFGYAQSMQKFPASEIKPALKMQHAPQLQQHCIPNTLRHKGTFNLLCFLLLFWSSSEKNKCLLLTSWNKWTCCF